MLQLTQWTKYAGQALANRTRVVWEEAPRGLIRDRHGRVLAENRAIWTVNIVPSDFPRDSARAEAIIARLASILGASTADIREQIEKIRGQATVEAMPLVKIGEEVPLEVVAAIEGQQLELPGVVVREVIKRHYPYGSLAAHLIGYTRPITIPQHNRVRDLTYPARAHDTNPQVTVPELAEEHVYTSNSIFGQDGVEASYELLDQSSEPIPVLQGRRGYQLYEVDATMRAVRCIERREPEPGATIYLTIDVRLQSVAERALHEVVANSQRTGAVVMMDVHSGEVLVMASKPGFDPNAWTKGFSSEQWQQIRNDERWPLGNKAVAGEYPPGSIFKMISATAALETTNLSMATTFRCDGAIHVGKYHQRYECWKHQGHGLVDFYKGMAESCDVYFYELVRKAGLRSNNLAKYAREFGLGSLTGIDLPGEGAGVVHDREWKYRERREPWVEGDTLNMVIGQGYLTVTPLQMAVATAAVANGGKLLTPRVVRKVHWPDWTGRGTQLFDEPQVRQIEVAADTLAKVRRGMRLAVTRPKGTGGVMSNLSVEVAGKTGSAEHHPSKPTHAWFVCFAPFENPKYAVAVFVSEGKSGGKTAAPIARKLLEVAFGLQVETMPGYSAPAASD